MVPTPAPSVAPAGTINQQNGTCGQLTNLNIVLLNETYFNDCDECPQIEVYWQATRIDQQVTSNGQNVTYTCNSADDCHLRTYYISANGTFYEADDDYFYASGGSTYKLKSRFQTCEDANALVGACIVFVLRNNQTFSRRVGAATCYTPAPTPSPMPTPMPTPMTPTGPVGGQTGICGLNSTQFSNDTYFDFCEECALIQLNWRYDNYDQAVTVGGVNFTFPCPLHNCQVDTYLYSSSGSLIEASDNYIYAVGGSDNYLLASRFQTCAQAQMLVGSCIVVRLNNGQTFSRAVGSVNCVAAPTPMPTPMPTPAPLP